MNMYEQLVTDDVVQVQQEGLMDNIKEYLNPSKLVEKLDLSKQKMIEMGVFFCIGIALGFLMKKYANFLIAAAITVGGIVLLHYIGFVDITLHLDRVQAMFGITMPAVQGNLFYHLWEWVKQHVAVVVSL